MRQVKANLIYLNQDFAKLVLNGLPTQQQRQENFEEVVFHRQKGWVKNIQH
ncbi:hypothetical protein CsSME_00044762 [Camellia sinensis var. sinensis]